MRVLIFRYSMATQSAVAGRKIARTFMKVGRKKGSIHACLHVDQASVTQGRFGQVKIIYPAERKHRYTCTHRRGRVGMGWGEVRVCVCACR